MESIAGPFKKYIEWFGFSQNHRQTDHLPPTTYQPTNQPTDHQPLTKKTTDQVHQKPTNRPSTNKKYEDQKFHNKL